MEFPDSVFLDCVRRGFMICDAISVVNIVFKVDYKPDFEDMIKNKIVFNRSMKTAKTNVNEQVKYYINLMNECKRRNYLSAPLEVSIYPTANCQLNCKFCYFKSKRNYYVKNLSSRDWIDILKQLKENKVISLSILGGEPTLYKEIDDLLRYVDCIQLKTTITTNGVNIKDSTFRLICDSKWITPTISLQALNSKNEQLMGIKSEKIVQTVKKFIKNKKIPRINTVYTIQTINDICAMIDFCVENGIKEYYVNAYMPIRQNKKYCYDFDVYKNLNETINRYVFNKGYDEKIYVSVLGCLLYSSYYDELPNPVTNEYENKIYGCEAGSTKIEIMPNGDVFPCAAFDINDFDYKNILDLGFNTLWNNGNYLNHVRSYKTKDKKCVKCKYCNFCNGGCPAYIMSQGNDIERSGDDRCKVNI